MDIDVDGLRVYLEVDKVGRECVARDQFLESVLDGMVQVTVFDIPSIGEEILFAPCLPGKFRFPDKPADIDKAGLLFNGDQALVVRRLRKG